MPAVFTKVTLFDLKMCQKSGKCDPSRLNTTHFTTLGNKICGKEHFLGLKIFYQLKFGATFFEHKTIFGPMNF